MLKCVSTAIGVCVVTALLAAAYNLQTRLAPANSRVLCVLLCVQAATLGVPLVEEDICQVRALMQAGVSVSWDGCRVVAPPGFVDEHGMCDLEPYLPAKRESKKQ